MGYAGVINRSFREDAHIDEVTAAVGGLAADHQRDETSSSNVDRQTIL